MSNNKNLKKTTSTTKSITLLFLIIILTLSIQFYSSYISASYNINTAIKTLFSYTPKEHYQPLSEPVNEANCKIAKHKTDKAINYFINDFHIQSWAYVIYNQCVKKQIDYSSLSLKILSDNPYHSIALQSAALTSFNKKDYLSAEYYYQVLHYLYPFDAGYTLLLAHIAVKQKNYSQAHRFYLKTLSISPNNAVAKETIKKLSSKGYISIH